MNLILRLLNIYIGSKLIDKEHALMKHKEIVLTRKHSALRNSFIDLYPSDATRGYPYSKDDESYMILLTSSNGDNSNAISIYQRRSFNIRNN